MKQWTQFLFLFLGIPGCLERFPPEDRIPSLSGPTLLGYPSVVNLAITPIKQGEAFLFVLTFSMPMDRESVEENLFLRRATEPVVKGTEGETIPLPRDSFQWNADATELSFSVNFTGSDPLVLVLTPNARAQNGKPLDGTTGPPDRFDPHSYHRIEEDGFSGPSTYISLPFFPGGSTTLSGQSSFLLSQSRPILACYPNGDRSQVPVTEGDLGSFSSSRPEILCTLWDQRELPEIPGSSYRKSFRAWDPEDLPRGTFLSKGGTIPAETHPGYRIIPSSLKVTILALESPISLRWQGTIQKAQEDFGSLFLAPATAPEPLYPITGFTENLLLFSPLRYLFHRALSRPLERKILVPEGTFLLSELVGDLLRVSSDPDYIGRIVANSASEIVANSITPCGFECEISIELDITAHFRIGEQARLVSPELTFSPREELEGGSWTLRVEGGRDLFGIPRTDRIRDGDEVRGVPDDDQIFTFFIP
jgi:hypothetical protein